MTEQEVVELFTIQARRSSKVFLTPGPALLTFELRTVHPRFSFELWRMRDTNNTNMRPYHVVWRDDVADRLMPKQEGLLGIRALIKLSKTVPGFVDYREFLLSLQAVLLDRRDTQKVFVLSHS